MERTSIAGVTLDRCAGCGAIWLDPGELARLLACTKSVLEADIGRSGPEARGQSLGEVVCPRDLTPLAPKRHPEQSHVIIDECPTCHGMLLDAGELRDIDQFTLVERLKSLLRAKRA